MRRDTPKATNTTADYNAFPPERVRVLALRRPKPAAGEGVTVVNTTSSGKDPRWRELSPFYAGPVPLYGGRVATCVENAWQFCKVYPEHSGTDGEPTEEYWAWAERGWADPKPRRFPMGRGRKPLYSLWDGQRLGYIEARKKIYAPLYAAAVTGSGAYATLREEYYAAVEGGGHLVLLDYDGWDHLGFGVDLRRVIDLEKPKMGHAFVLAGLLEDDHFWY